ncbi:MAG: hypothetical protein SOY98_04195 [Candidatus Cryptobacteroides sp.]|nr:hypothetical protein [Candidatus Cryptobacteroides sp.]
MIAGFASCIREQIETPVPSGEEGTVSIQVDYRPLESSLEGVTKSAGDLIRTIDNISVVAYNSDDGKFAFSKYFTTSDYALEEVASPSGTYAESKVYRASFNMVVPRGRYRIYAVVNMDRELAADERASEDALKSISLDWLTTGDKACSPDNNKMFGFFTDNASTVIPSAAPELVVGTADVSLHAWVKRTVSKVTVAYDATELKDNIYIYLKSVQILDIPKTCYLGKENVPASADALIHEGEMLTYSTSDDKQNWPYVSKGNPVYQYDGGHTETAQALYFFENNQGTGEKHNYHPGDAAWDKDKKPYGTYIEVKGYYVNRTADNSSQGPIIYRFMLGKDVSSDFNAERSNHYKVTLKFRNDANDPDWHIVYEPEQPEITIPDPLYISYVPNESVNVPVVVRGANASTQVKADIIESHWYGDKGHKYQRFYYQAFNGILTLQPTGGSLADEAARESDFNAKNGFSYTPSQVLADRCLYSIPVYTRGLTLGNSFSGYNYFPHDTRTGKIRFSVTVNGKTYTKDVRIIQVKRVVNPAGVWREASSTKTFNFRLMELNEDDDSENGAVHRQFYPTISDGPWTAHIEQGADWVQIAPTGTNNWGTSDVTGGTASEVRFDVRPGSTCGDGTVRHAVVKVTYNNNTCIHYFFVSQGIGEIPMAVDVNYGDYKDRSATSVYGETRAVHTCYWMNRNMKYSGVPCENPLMEGGKFRWGNSSQSFKPEDDFRDGYGFNQVCYSTISPSNEETFNIKRHWLYQGTDASLAEVGHTEMPIGFKNNKNSYTSRFYDNLWPAKYADWTALQQHPRYYGVLYGEESTETATNTTDAYTYINLGDVKGMQGLFVWDKGNARHLFFPIGATGHGHRKASDIYQTKAGYEYDGHIDRDVLKYAQRPTYMKDNKASSVPMLYDLWMRKGAIYWYEENEFYTTNKELFAHDINYYTYDLNTYGANPVTMVTPTITYNGATCRKVNWSDACYVRCVHY